MKDYHETDVLIIGGGIDGSAAAAILAKNGVNTTMVCKGKNYSHTNTNWAQGGIAWLTENETPEDFINDIMQGGDFINNRRAVTFLVEQSHDLVKQVLLDFLEIPFSTTGDGYDLAIEGAHSNRRILNVKDMTGKVIQEHFYRYLKKQKNLHMLYRHTAIDLLTYPHHSMNPMRMYEEPRAIGAYVLDQVNKKVVRVFAKKIVLATGGLSSIFLHSTNPPDASGDGVAMAYRAAARLGHLEYVQFHPTALYHKEVDSFLISEAVRGEGARLKNRRGEFFMERYSPERDLAPRDEVSRAIYAEMIKNDEDYVLLDLASFAKINIRERFPTIYQTCKHYGIDIESRPIPVVPAAHYSCGGVMVDLKGRTTLKNLYAIGEVATTGVHGANRLASVSLLEGLVWGVSAARDICEVLSEESSPYVIAEVPDWKYPQPQEELDPALVMQDRVTIKYIMWNYAGIIRTPKRLERASSDLEYLSHRINKFYQKTEITNSIINLRNSVQTALLVVRAALQNRTSRGAHFIKALED